jgi:HPt (histidine-containing phosphotransfer) domain-containing protein
MEIPLELKLKYLKRRLEEIEEIKKLIPNNDFELAAKLGHQIKGNASTFSFDELSSLGQKIEQAALRQNKEQVLMFIGELEQQVSRLVIISSRL